MADRTPAETLRAAAAKVREVASPTVPGPYTSHWIKGRVAGAVYRGQVHLATTQERIGTPRPHMADWVALMSPLLADPLARWMEHHAVEEDADECFFIDVECPALHAALVILGESGDG